MNKLFLTLLFVINGTAQPVFVNSTPQPKKEIKIIKLIGKVIDCHTKHPIYSVKITAGDKHTHTEMDGTFKLYLEDYEILKFEFLGKEPFSVHSEQLNNTIIEL